MNDPVNSDDALRDPITGLPQLELEGQRLAQWLENSVVDGQNTHVHALLLGIRRFDAVNMAYGASVGDVALTEVGSRLKHFAGNELDGPFRVIRAGGSQFLIFAVEPCSRERWQLFAEQLGDIVAKPIALSGSKVRLSPRLALLRALTEETLESIVDRLSQTLQAAQRAEGRRLAWADKEAFRPGWTAAQLEADLLRALDRDEIEIVFQAQYSVATDELTGAEALARWNHPELGRIGAAALFSIAERADYVPQLSLHIARLALNAATLWPDHLRLSLNVTAADLSVASFAQVFQSIVAKSGFPADRLTLEVTEQALVTDIELAKQSLTRLSEAGMRIALDDFGAGFCNFRYLKLLPLNYLKLDRSMVDGIADNQRDLAVFKAIVAMARALDLEVIAEGIESDVQRQRIADEGCAFYQGFLRARPMSAARFLQQAKGD